MRSLFFLLFSFFTLSATAQKLFLGQKGITFYGGIPLVKERSLFSESDYVFSFEVSRQMKNRSYASFSLSYVHNAYDYRDTTVPTTLYLGALSYLYPLLYNYHRTVNLYIGVSAFCGYEHINYGKPLLPDGATLLNASRFVYGSSVRLSIETYFTHNLAIVLRGEAPFYFNTEMELFRPHVGVGLRINF